MTRTAPAPSRGSAGSPLPRTLAAGLVTGALLVGCAQQPEGVGSPVTAPPAASAPPSASSSPAVAGSPVSPSASASAGAASGAGPAGPVVPGEPEVLVTGLEAPWALAFLPGGDALVTERDSGRLLRVPAAGGEPEVVGTVEVDDAGEGGLLGVAVSPDAPDDVYLYRSAPRGNAVVRFSLASHEAGTSIAPETVLDGIPHAQVHNGGRLAFGPDGMLYVTTGDSRTPQLAQDPTSLAGKVLRLMPDGSTPADNPDPSSPVFTLGHRNVQGLAWDADGRLYASEFGADTFDELNLLQPGRNYGWPEVEGAGGGEELTDPLLTWAPRDASPSGVGLAGDSLWVAALRGQRLWQVPLDGDGGVTEPTARFVDQFGRLRAAQTAPDGSLWVLTNNRDGRGTPGPDDDRVLRVPVVPA